MSAIAATHQTAAVRGPTRTCCQRCGAALNKPATLVEMSHHSNRGVERDAKVVCIDCAAELTSFLRRRAELAGLEPTRRRTTLRGGLDRCGGGFAGLSRADATPIAIRRK